MKIWFGDDFTSSAHLQWQPPYKSFCRFALGRSIKFLKVTQSENCKTGLGIYLGSRMDLGVGPLLHYVYCLQIGTFPSFPPPNNYI